MEIDPTTFSMFGPDFPFDYHQWLSHPAGLGHVPPERMGEEVAVIGAGMAGMVAAYELMRVGLKPVVYEAGRIGGRLRSERFSGAPLGATPAVAELGGMRFPISSRALGWYFDLLGLERRAFPNPLTPAAQGTVVDLDGAPIYARSLQELPPLFQEVAAAWEQALESGARLADLQSAMAAKDAPRVKEVWNALIPQWDDRTFYDFIASSDAFQKLSFRHREVFGQVGFGTGGWDSDFPNSMLEILRVVASRSHEDQEMVVGGSELAPRGLWEHAPAQIAHWPAGTSLSALHLGAPRPGVKRIERAANERIAVIDRWGDKRDYAAVLSTAQSWLLTTSISVQEDLFSPQLWMALDRTRYMQSSKTFVMVDRPIWREKDPRTGRPRMSMTLTDRHIRGVYLFDHGPNEPGVICLSYAWMGDALKVLPLTAQERVEKALEAVEKIYPGLNLAQHIVGDPIAVSWEADPHFLGAFKGALPGHYRYNQRMYAHAFEQSVTPSQERGIFLAGDDVSWTPGWAEGAVQTALNAFCGIVRHLGGGSAIQNAGPLEAYPALGPIKLPD